MKSVTLPKVRFTELAQLIDDIKPGDLGGMKDIRLASKIVNDLREEMKDDFAKADELAKKRQGIVEPFQTRFKEESKDLQSEEAKELKEQELNAELKKELEEKLGEEAKALDEAFKQEITLELSDDKFSKVQEWFPKFITPKYNNKIALIEVADAFEIE